MIRRRRRRLRPLAIQSFPTPSASCPQRCHRDLGYGSFSDPAAIFSRAEATKPCSVHPFDTSSTSSSSYSSHGTRHLHLPLRSRPELGHREPVVRPFPHSISLTPLLPLRDLSLPLLQTGVFEFLFSNNPKIDPSKAALIDAGASHDLPTPSCQLTSSCPQRLAPPSHTPSS